MTLQIKVDHFVDDDISLILVEIPFIMRPLIVLNAGTVPPTEVSGLRRVMEKSRTQKDETTLRRVECRH